MHALTDTIVAPITAVGGAVAVLRLSGSNAWRIAQAVSGATPIPGGARYVRYRHGDDGIATLFAKGRSYTGEEVAEISCHGSAVSVRTLVESCIGAGARPAMPGEFTLRAFMNGRLDLTQAEGVRDTVEALTGAQLRQASLLRSGALLREIRALRERLIGSIASIEASVDFSDEVGELDREALAAQIAVVESEVAALLGSAAGARLVREGLTVAIIGRPNAGKSSLFNRVLRSDRAIVTAQPGTTRDTLRETIEHEGMAVTLLDTAGLRPASDEVERIGVARSMESAQGADVVWHVFDATQGPDGGDGDLATQRPTILVANKSDLLADGVRSKAGIPVSALTGDGIPALLRATVGTVESGPGLVNSRHRPLLEEAALALRDASQGIADGVPDDLAAVCLHSAVRCLGEITGEAASPDILQRVFQDFCIGK